MKSQQKRGTAAFLLEKKGCKQMISLFPFSFQPNFIKSSGLRGASGWNASREMKFFDSTAFTCAPSCLPARLRDCQLLTLGGVRFSASPSSAAFRIIKSSMNLAGRRSSKVCASGRFRETATNHNPVTEFSIVTKATTTPGAAHLLCCRLKGSK